MRVSQTKFSNHCRALAAAGAAIIVSAAGPAFADCSIDQMACKSNCSSNPLLEGGGALSGVWIGQCHSKCDDRYRECVGHQPPTKPMTPQEQVAVRKRAQQVYEAAQQGIKAEIAKGDALVARERELYRETDKVLGKSPAAYSDLVGKEVIATSNLMIHSYARYALKDHDFDQSGSGAAEMIVKSGDRFLATGLGLDGVLHVRPYSPLERTFELKYWDLPAAAVRLAPSR